MEYFSNSTSTWNDSSGHCEIILVSAHVVKPFEINLPPSAQPPKKTAKKPLARRHFRRSCWERLYSYSASISLVGDGARLFTAVAGLLEYGEESEYGRDSPGSDWRRVTVTVVAEFDIRT